MEGEYASCAFFYIIVSETTIDVMRDQYWRLTFGAGARISDRVSAESSALMFYRLCK